MASTDAEVFLRDLYFRKGFRQATDTGDLATEEGLENYRQALIRRMITVPGSVAHRPTYGVGLPMYQNAPNTFATKRDLALKVQDQLAQDSRTAEVLGVTVEFDDLTPERLKVTVRVKPIGRSEISLAATPFGEVV